MNINQCERLAQEMGKENIEFYLVGPKGKRKAKWLDPWMGLFIVDGSDGFSMVRDYELMENLTCEWVES